MLTKNQSTYSASHKFRTIPSQSAAKLLLHLKYNSRHHRKLRNHLPTFHENIFRQRKFQKLQLDTRNSSRDHLLCFHTFFHIPQQFQLKQLETVKKRNLKDRKAWIVLDILKTVDPQTILKLNLKLWIRNQSWRRSSQQSWLAKLKPVWTSEPLKLTQPKFY